MPKKIQKTKVKANTVHVDHRNIVGIDIGKRKHAATAVTPKGGVIASLASFCKFYDLSASFLILQCVRVVCLSYSQSLFASILMRSTSFSPCKTHLPRRTAPSRE